jgi:co-chaperonin GroES (HSP10)
MLTTAKRTRHNYATVNIKPEDVTPLYDNLLVRRIYEAPSGYIIDPGVHQTLDGRWLKNSDEGPRKGIVLAIGKGDKAKIHPYKPGEWDWRKPMDVRVGDTIIYPRFESSHIKIGDEMLTFVREADVMAVIEND